MSPSPSASERTVRRIKRIPTVDPVVSADADDAASATDRVYQRLRELIVGGQIAPGGRVVESDFVRALAASRASVRGALSRLRREHYIVARSRGRSEVLSVAPLTQDDATELFSVIGTTEGLCAARAAGLPADARRQLAKTMRALNVGLASAGARARRDAIRLFDLDAQLHAAVVAAGAGPRLLTLHQSVMPQAERYLRVYVSSMTDQLEFSLAEHDALIDEIDAGNAPRARAAAERNWTNAAERMGRVIRALGERGRW